MILRLHRLPKKCSSMVRVFYLRELCHAVCMLKALVGESLLLAIITRLQFMVFGYF